MCAAETALEVPETTIDALLTSPVPRSTVKVPVPVAAVDAGGTSSAPESGVLIVVVPAAPAGTVILPLSSPSGKAAV
jgi:hypothetical protein